MRGKSINRRFVALCDPDLGRKRIRFDVNSSAALKVFLSQLLPGNVQECIRLPAKLKNLLLGQSIALAIGVSSPETPFAAKPVSLQYGGDRANVSAGIRRQIVDGGIVHPAWRIFDVVWIIAEPSQPNQIV